MDVDEVLGEISTLLDRGERSGGMVGPPRWSGDAMVAAVAWAVEAAPVLAEEGAALDGYDTGMLGAIFPLPECVKASKLPGMAQLWWESFAHVLRSGELFGRWGNPPNLAIVAEDLEVSLSQLYQVAPTQGLREQLKRDGKQVADAALATVLRRMHDGEAPSAESVQAAMGLLSR